MNDGRIDLVRSRSEQLAWLETGVIAFAYPLVGFAVDRTDPFLTGGGFAWIALPPVLIGLRHGFVRAAAGAAVLLAAVWLSARFLPFMGSGHLPDSVTVGTLLLATFAGLFSDAYRRRTDDLRDAYDTVWSRYQTLARDFLLLEVSHERLARQGGGGPLNLRSLLENTESWTTGQGVRDLTSVGQVVLDLVESNGLVEEASVHAVCEGRLRPEPVAVIGAPPTVAADDALVRAALETKRISIVNDTVGDEGAGHGTLLAVVPFVDVEGVCHGLLAIRTMPFIAFEEDNLRLLSVLAGRIGDLLSDRVPAAQGPKSRLLDLYVKRACQEAREQGTSHALAVIKLEARSDASELLEKLEAVEVRAADRSVLLYDESREPVLCVVLAMTQWADVAVFQRRVDTWCRETLGQTVEEAGGEVRLVRVGGPRTAAELVREVLNGGMGHESPASSLRTDQLSRG